MFGLFKKKTWAIDGKTLSFFGQVFSALPAEFNFLLEGLNKGLYRTFSVNPTMQGHFVITFDPSQSDRSMVKGKQFELENIVVRQGGESYPLNLSVYQGLWIAFEFSKSISDLKDFQVDVSLLEKNRSKLAPNEEIKKLVDGLICEQLDLHDLGEFDVNDKIYYQIKDLEDGNYLAIDDKGQVFGLIHDPFKIELVNKSIRQFVDDVNDGKFDFEGYLNGQSGYHQK